MSDAATRLGRAMARVANRADEADFWKERYETQQRKLYELEDEISKLMDKPNWYWDYCRARDFCERYSQAIGLLRGILKREGVELTEEDQFWLRAFRGDSAALLTEQAPGRDPHPEEVDAALKWAYKMKAAFSKGADRLTVDGMLRQAAIAKEKRLKAGGPYRSEEKSTPWIDPDCPSCGGTGYDTVQSSRGPYETDRIPCHRCGGGP